jgi:hypothetical protein
MDIQERYAEASVKTADNLRTIAQSKMLRDLSSLSLPEIDAVVNVIARLTPAGNVPGVILNGLARLKGRKPPFKTVRRDIDLLFTGIKQSLDEAVYSAFFAGPAAVIWCYQNLLRLAGKDPEDSFPEGVWQFYVDYALREDTARHTNETHGFDTLLSQHQIHLSPVDRTTAWVMAAVYCLHQYPHLLANEWRERVYTYLLAEIAGSEPDAERYTRLYRDWEKRRPYGRGPDAGADETYPTYRRAKFYHFLEETLHDLQPALRYEWARQARVAKERDLPAYQQQMSILAYLEPGDYGETRTPIPLNEAHVGVIHRGRYYLVPACVPGTDQPADVAMVRMQVAALMDCAPDVSPTQLVSLARIKRTTWPALRRELNQTLVKELDRLRLAPILLNCGPCPRHLPLSELRQAERGIGDHALTLFDTGESMVFDQSHIFFDGAWGAALAEIMTQEALAWATYLNTLPPVQLDTDQVPGQTCHALTFPLQGAELSLIRQAPYVIPEVGAETDAVDLKAMLRLRKLFKQRSDLLQLTVNDLLILYRAIHALTYQPAPDLVSALKSPTSHSGPTRHATQEVLKAIDDSQKMNPPMVIPVDGSQHIPRERLYPMTFEVPLVDLDLLSLHEETKAALDAYESEAGDRMAVCAKFDQLQRTYLAALAGFGVVMSRAKEIAVAGESASVGTIKLLAHLPTPLQRMLDKIPSRIDLLNDLIKGREVFSNVGAVAPTSTLTRFITAKDDNDKKTLAWGVITDAQGVMRITLRDFRPHVALLESVGRGDLAVRLARDYLDSYARGLNSYIDDLRRITETSRGTRLGKLEKRND